MNFLYELSGWRGNFVLAAMESWLKLELTKNFKVIRDLELLPELLGQDWSSVFLQRFEGAITIWPRTQLRDWFRLLSDPDPPELERMINTGQIATWPKLHMIENRSRIERQIFLGRQAVRKSAQRTPISKHPSLPPPGRTTTPPPTGSDPPMSVDTDAESAFTNGARWVFKRGHRTSSPSGTTTPREGLSINTSRDPLKSPSIRRKWASELLHPDDNAPIQHGTSSNTSGTPRSSGFFGNMRQLSTPDGTWSSDTSSDDDLTVDDHRHLHHPSVLNLSEAYHTNEGERNMTTDSSWDGEDDSLDREESLRNED